MGKAFYAEWCKVKDAKIFDLRAELAEAKSRLSQLEDHTQIEMGCLTCGTKFSVKVEDEVDWVCPVCCRTSTSPDHVMVTVDDLGWIVNLTERKSQDAKYNPKFLRLKAVLEGKEKP